MRRFLREHIAGLLYTAGFPFVLLRVSVVIVKGLFSIPDSAWAFGTTDFFFRGWYQKIATDFRTMGRFGYAWDDGIGLPLGPRFYNNAATYGLYDRLGSVRYSVIGWLLSAAVATAMVATGIAGDGHILLAALTGLWVLVSPAMCVINVQLGKPEVFWWWLPAIGFLAGLGLHIGWASAIWSVLTMLNLPVALLAGIVFGLPIAYVAFSDMTTAIGLLWLLPGILKILLRVIQSMRSGYLQMLVSEQANIWRRSLVPQSDEIGYLVLSVALVLIVRAAGADAAAIRTLIGFAALFQGLYYLNWRWMYVNDPQSFLLLFFWGTLALAVTSGFPASLLVPAISAIRFIGNIPPDSSATGKSADGSGLVGRATALLGRLFSFPSLKLIERPSVLGNPLSDAISALDCWSRIAVESPARMREVAAARRFHMTILEPLTQRRIATVNDMYAGMTQAVGDDHRWKEFQLKPTDLQETRAMLQSYWVKYVVATSDEMCLSLEQTGFTRLKTVHTSSDALLRRVLTETELRRIPRVHILRAPYPVPSIEPVVQKKTTIGIAISREPARAPTTLPYAFFPGIGVFRGTIDVLAGEQETGKFIEIIPESGNLRSSEPLTVVFGRSRRSRFR